MILIILCLFHLYAYVGFYLCEHSVSFDIEKILKEGLFEELGGFDFDGYHKKKMLKDFKDTDLDRVTQKEWDILLPNFDTTKDKKSYHFPMRAGVAYYPLNNLGSWGIGVYVADDIMQNPKLIKNLFRILTKPCYYLVSGEELGCNIRSPIIEKIFFPCPDLFFVQLVFEKKDGTKYPPIFIKREDIEMNPFSVIMPLILYSYVGFKIFIIIKWLILWCRKRVRNIGGI